MRIATRPLPLLLVALTAAWAGGCGGDDEPEPRQAQARVATTTDTTGAEPGETSKARDKSERVRDAALARRPAGEDGLRVPAIRAKIVAGESAFGRVLFDANGQVVYAFENDRRNRSNCTSEECVEAWPPVLTKQQPSAGAGVDSRLLGTIRRSDGALHVTYNRRPLYFYEHEGPGEIKCHNVELHGGLWWVVTPRGEPAN